MEETIIDAEIVEDVIDTVEASETEETHDMPTDMESALNAMSPFSRMPNLSGDKKLDLKKAYKHKFNISHLEECDILPEIKLINEKKSYLSKSQRDAVLSYFFMFMRDNNAVPVDVKGPEEEVTMGDPLTAEEAHAALEEAGILTPSAEDVVEPA